MEYIIGKMKTEDWEGVREIYLEGIKTGNSTFQTQAPDWEEWDTGHSSECRLVAKKRDDVLGWAALSPVSSRCVYSGVAEVSIYVGEKYRKNNIGTNLLKELVKISERNGFWTLQAGVFPENKASLLLHKKYGFREVGIREKIGKMKNGEWRDVVLLERRSNKVGIN